jgi:CCR4-NOT transcription complex subunit 1
MRILQAVEMIDGEIKQPFSQLRRQKELLGSGYYDAFPYTQGLARVPDALRPKPAGLLCATQQRVYEVKHLSINNFLCILLFLA